MFRTLSSSQQVYNWRFGRSLCNCPLALVWPSVVRYTALCSASVRVDEARQLRFFTIYFSRGKSVGLSPFGECARRVYPPDETTVAKKKVGVQAV